MFENEGFPFLLVFHVFIVIFPSNHLVFTEVLFVPLVDNTGFLTPEIMFRIWMILALKQNSGRLPTNNPRKMFSLASPGTKVSYSLRTEGVQCIQSLHSRHQAPFLIY